MEHHQYVKDKIEDSPGADSAEMITAGPGSSRASGGAPRGPESWELLLGLPADILVGQVLIPYLSHGDKSALRQASMTCRALANAAVTSCVLDVHGDSTAAHVQIPSSFPNLQSLQVTSTSQQCGAGASSSTNSNRPAKSSKGGASRSASNDSSMPLQEQLPLLLHKLPSLSSLVYEGPKDRRQAGLDMTPALQQLAAAAAGMVAAGPAPQADVTSGASTAAGIAVPSDTSCVSTDTHTNTLQPLLKQHVERQQQQQQQQGQSCSTSLPAAPSLGLQSLELRCGALPDVLMDAVGRLSSLVSLKLSSTTAINMFPVSKLTRLTSLHMTVTPPLSSALSPLSCMTRLAELHLAALSPARGWGRALALLAPCSLRHLVLTFADVGDDDIQHMAAALTAITRLNLNYSRHLTPGCVPHLASLSHLHALHLEETGLQLRQHDMLLLGDGCHHLTTLEASFDLRDVAPPPLFTVQEWRRKQLTQIQHVANAPCAPGLGCNQSEGFTASPLMASRQAREGWPWLRQLRLNGVSVSDFNKLLDGLPGLTCLVLSSIGANSDHILKHMVHYSLPLQDLCLSHCGTLGSEVVDTLAQGLTQLKALTLQEVAVSRHAAADWFSGGISLESLTLCRCNWADDYVLQSGVCALASLQHLVVSGCTKVTQCGLLSVAGKLPHLTKLVVQDCPSVSSRTIRACEVAMAAGRVAAKSQVFQQQQQQPEVASH